MKLFLQFLAAMLVGTAIGAYALPKLGGEDNIATNATAANPAIPAGDPSNSVVDNLQQQLLQASKERKKLEQQIQQLRAAQADPAALTGAEEQTDFEESADLDVEPAEESRAEIIERIREARSPQAQQQRLLDAGFSQDEIIAIERAEANYQTARIEDRLAEMRANPDAYERQLDPRGYQPIREELGDDRFEDYLQANGVNPNVVTRNVIPGSAAEQAGIQSGDQIYSYDGSRVFQSGDVTRGTISGTLNESVIIEVKRDDQIISLTAPRGTLGVTLGNQRGGRFGRGGRGP